MFRFRYQLPAILLALAAPALIPRALEAQSSSPTPTPHHHSRHGDKAQDASSNSSPERGSTTPKPSPAKREAKSSTGDEIAPAKTPGPPDAAADGQTKSAPAATATIDPEEIENFEAQPEPIRQLLMAALTLTKGNLTYTYGSADPAAGGMDCSGTMYYLLRQSGFGNVPRQANEQYSWVREKSRFYAVLSKKQDSAELNEMRPGDLLFWTGTYNVDRDPPVTHTMIYLGRRRKDGHRLMVGASDGRTYDGQRRNGVSVFDFHLPIARSGDAVDAATAAAPDHSPNFAGYGPIPGIADLNDAASRQTSAADSGAEKEASPSEDQPSPAPKIKRTHGGHHVDS